MTISWYNININNITKKHIRFSNPEMYFVMEKCCADYLEKYIEFRQAVRTI